MTPSGKWKPISQFPEKCWLLVAKNLPRKPLSSPRSFLDIGTLSFFFFFFKFFSFFVFRDRVSLYSPDCPGTHFVDQAGPELRNLSASASQVQFNPFLDIFSGFTFPILIAFKKYSLTTYMCSLEGLYERTLRINENHQLWSEGVVHALNYYTWISEW